MLLIGVAGAVMAASVFYCPSLIMGSRGVYCSLLNFLWPACSLLGVVTCAVAHRWAQQDVVHLGCLFETVFLLGLGALILGIMVVVGLIGILGLRSLA